MKSLLSTCLLLQGTTPGGMSASQLVVLNQVLQELLRAPGSEGDNVGAYLGEVLEKLVQRGVKASRSQVSVKQHQDQGEGVSSCRAAGQLRHDAV